MSDRSCCDCSLEADTFCDNLFDVFIRGGTYAVMFCTISYLIDKTAQHGGKINELFSRLKECEKNHELKK